ncbi:MAG: DUF1559 domain-containing protein [Gemmataceae bacterium]
MTRHRRGFTLIELLVVIAILAAVLGLLLPAVQKVRSAAARMECQNGLRQISLACHQHHDTHHRFPAGWHSRTGPHASKRYSGWTLSVLPYLEQPAVFSAALGDYARSAVPFNAPLHQGLGTVVRAFACPADGRTRTLQRASVTGHVVGLTSYLGVSGTTTAAGNGILHRDSRVTFGDITDGTSSTLIIGERPPSPDFQFGWWYAGAGLAFTGNAELILGLREPNLVATAVLRPCPRGRYRFMPGSVSNPCDMLHFWSLHPGGANFALADGSVRFIGYESHPVMPALATRAGQEAVTDTY